VTTFPDLARFQDEAATTGNTLTLPVAGREYTFASNLTFGRALEFEAMRTEAQRMLAAKAAGKAKTYKPTDEFVKRMETFDEKKVYLELIGDEMQEVLLADNVLWQTVLHIGATLFAWHMTGKAVALQVWTRGKLEDSDIRPPAKSSGSSKARTTSRTGSATTKPRKPAVRATRGATTSTAGRSSKPTSSASTESTSPRRKSTAAKRGAGSASD
jgi:hypothetical protein